MEMVGVGAGGFDSKRVRMIGGIAFLLLALVFTFGIPLTIAVEDMDLLVSTGEPNIEPIGQQLDIGRPVTGYAQEFVVDQDCQAGAVKFRIGTLVNTYGDLVVGIAEDKTVFKDDMLAFTVIPAFQSPSTDHIFDLPDIDLSSNRTYYMIIMVDENWWNDTSITQYYVENTEVDYPGQNWGHFWDRLGFGFDSAWTEVLSQPYGATDMWFELYGFWVDEDENGVPDEDEEEPAWIDNQTAGIMILWVGSLFAGLGGGMLLTQVPEIEQRPWIALVGGMAIFLGWFFLIANPWLLITMVPAIVRW